MSVKETIKNAINSVHLVESVNKYIDCPSCGGQNKLSVLKEGADIKYHCFRASCFIKGVISGRRTIEQTKGFLLQCKQPPAKNYGLPIPSFESEISKNCPASKYLLQSNCTEAYTTNKIKITWAVKEERVLFFTKDHKGAVGRTLNKYGPKWVTYGDCSTGISVGEGPTVVLVEDAASACSVSRLPQYTGFALLGTKMKDSYKERLNSFKKCLVVLDNDAKSQAFKVARELRIPASIRLTKYDLKMLSKAEVNSVLLGGELYGT